MDLGLGCTQPILRLLIKCCTLEVMGQTKREYLIEKGLAKGRGRLSAEAKKAVEKAINKGVKFDDGKSVASEVPEVAEPRHDRPEGMYTFKNPDGSTFERLHKNACAKCHYSFQWCYCVEGPTQFPHPYTFGQGDVYATLYGVPSRYSNVVEVKPVRRGRGRPRKAA
jgi:hypothetical protein